MRETSTPIRAIQCAVVDGFAEMHGGDVFAGIEVGDCAADAQDFVVCASGKSHFFHRHF